MGRDMAKPADIRIGISGWTYPPWRGHFYPEGLVQKRELEFASRVFRAIEVNGTFYGLQTPPSFEKWRRETPDDFVFPLKAPRYITHIRRLREPRIPIANYLASGLLKLGPKLGPILWQIPPSMGFDPVLIEDFLKLLPHDTEAAAEVARQHDDARTGKVWTETEEKRPMRHAIEIRNESFRDPAFIALLRRYDVALVCADTAKWPKLLDLTSDFVYCRLHGSEELYRSNYLDEVIATWADRVVSWATGKSVTDGDMVTNPIGRARKRDVFLFFDNTEKRNAPVNAQTMMQQVAARL